MLDLLVWYQSSSFHALLTLYRVTGQNGSGQNGTDKMVYGQNGIGQNGMDKMVQFYIL